MIDRRVESYVHEMRRRGYSDELIGNRLAQSKYTATEITEALHQQPGLPIHLPPQTIIIAFIAVVILVAGGLVFYFLASPTSSKTVALFSVSLQRFEFSPQDTISFSRTITGGTPKEVSFLYEIIDTKTNIVVHRESEQGTPVGNTASIRIPPNAALGTHLLRVTATIDGRKTIKLQEITIIKKSLAQDTLARPTCTDAIQNQDETDTDCGGVCPPCAESQPENQPPPTTTKPELPSLPSPKEPQTQTLSPLETLEQIKKMAATDDQKAAASCRELESSVFKDTCFSSVAQESKKAVHCRSARDELIRNECLAKVALLIPTDTLCEEISLERSRDVCYLAFVREFNDYSVCFKISNENLKRSCEILRDTQ